MAKSKSCWLILLFCALCWATAVLAQAPPEEPWLPPSGASQYGTQNPSIPCPRGCHCFRTTVRCIFQQLYEIPVAQIPPDTTILDLRFNKLRVLRSDAFRRLSSLQNLLLNNNELESIEDGAFDGLTQLHSLYLYRNRLRRLTNATFGRLPAVTSLFLQNNELESIETRAFAQLPSLKRLYLNNNSLRTISLDSLESIKQLDRLRLDANPFDCQRCEFAEVADFLRRRSDLEADEAPATCQEPNALRAVALRRLNSGDDEQQVGGSIGGGGHHHRVEPAFGHCALPKFTQQPPVDVGVRRGETVYLPCKAEGASQILWMHNRTMIQPRSSNGRYEIMRDGTLMIARADEAVHGYYDCMAKSPAGQVARARRALVRYFNDAIDTQGQQQPRIFRTPADVEADVGGEARFQCQADGRPPPVITWTKDGQQLTTGQDLHLKNLTRRSSGTYKCTASNSRGTTSVDARLHVRYAPEFTIAPQGQDAIEGTKVSIRCEAIGHPPPALHWTKDGRQLGHTRGVTVENGGQSLSIYPFLRQDAGLYVCHAKNVVDQRQASSDVRVRHSSPPRIVIAPVSVQGRLGETVNFQCRAAGEPSPKIVWQFNGSPVPTVRGHYEISNQNTLYVNGITAADSGHYTCQAVNEAGVMAVDASLTLVTNQPATARPAGPAFPPGRLLPGAVVSRELIESSIRKATQNVDRAINATRLHLYDGKPKSPSELLAIFRFPGPQAIELARAREIYEQTLRLIQEHVTGGLRFANLTNFQYEQILSPAHLQLISELTGCSVHREQPRCNDMCFHGKYRTYDGTCNNLQVVRSGASLTAFKRLVPAIYENGFDLPVGWDHTKRYAGGFAKPNPRSVSTAIITTRRITSDTKYSHMLMQWGQFMDHDLDFAILSPSIDEFREDGLSCKTTCRNNPPCFNIDVPDGDPRIDKLRSPVPCIELERSSAVCGSGETSVFFNKVHPREQINQITTYIDASNVYGSTEDDALDLRDLFSDHGLLKFDIASHAQKPYLPFNRDHAMDCRRNRSIEHSVRCFWAGDHRANEQLGLLSMHTLWLREHNRIAGVLLQINPHWDGEKIYQEARKIVGAQLQHITYESWLPKVLGMKGMKLMGEYKGYEPKVDPSIANEFATAAFRFGHTLIQPQLARLNASFQPIPEGPIALHEAFFAPDRLLNEGGIDPLLRGLFASPAKLLKFDQFLNQELTEKLFAKAQMGLDLSALNIQRGRDHALAGYTALRRWCNLSVSETFDGLSADIPDRELRQKLQRMYGHPDNVDLWVGGLTERPIDSEARIGPTFACIIADQFRRLRDGDRFWYESPGVFTAVQLHELRRATLAKVLCHNGDEIDRVQEDVFLYPGEVGPQNPIGNGMIKSCGEIPDINLNMWQECCDSTCGGARQGSSTKDEDDEEEGGDDGRSRRGGTHRYKRSWNEKPQTAEQTSPSHLQDTSPKTSEMQSQIDQLLATVNRLKDTVEQLVKEKASSCQVDTGMIVANGDEWTEAVEGAEDEETMCRCEDGRIVCEKKTKKNKE